MGQNRKELSLREPGIVGIVHSVEAYREIEPHRLASLAAVELRLDHMSPPTGWVPEDKGAALLATARDPREGGHSEANLGSRKQWLRDALAWASAIDVELASVQDFSEELHAARERGVAVVLSFHDFEKTPPLAVLKDIRKRAIDAGADVVKVAARTGELADLRTLMDWLEDGSGRAAMGMGRLGRLSRLVLRAAGSRLNYGWLDRPAVPGQWSAEELGVRLEEVCGE